MVCKIHNLPFKLVPAGVSKKTGKAYNAFYACPTQGCFEKPVSEEKGQILKEASEDQAYISGLVESASPNKPQPKAEDNVWELKDKQSMSQTAVKSASEIVTAFANNGAYESDEEALEKVKLISTEIFNHIQNLKNTDSTKPIATT